jgi:Flp pilus assembly protein TadG
MRTRQADTCVRTRLRRRDERGATLVEFALVSPLVFLVIFGIIAGCYLAFQNSSLHDGATAGARAASIETSLVAPTSGQFCESGKPVSIEKSVSQAAPILAVNQAPLCATSANATTLTQSPTVPGDVNIIVTCGGSCASPTSTEVALAVTTKGLLAPFSVTYHLSASSQVPVLSP